ncbi:MAG: GNAT family N-acetyltransferase [Anaerolineales bacterium]|nr:GNAT family N-acetyltransferase [Anaerolineales bacterium]
MTIELAQFDHANHLHLRAIAQLWNASFGQDMSVSERLVEYNTRPLPHAEQAGRFVVHDGMPVAFVLTSMVHDEPELNSASEGWVDALAVDPAHRNTNFGSTLLEWAENWLCAHGAEFARLGAGLRPFAPGIATSLGLTDFFMHRGYSVEYTTCDVAANLAHYATPPCVREVPAAVRPAQPGQEPLILDFLRREFCGRWRYDAEALFAAGERLSDFMLLWTEHGVQGCCLVTFEDSLRPIERYFPYRLPRPWGHVGSIGVAESRRGQGMGAYLLDAALRRLHDNGVNGCVIDWTMLLDFYGKFGFTPYREYQCLLKPLCEQP